MIKYGSSYCFGKPAVLYESQLPYGKPLQNLWKVSFSIFLVTNTGSIISLAKQRYKIFGEMCVL